MKNDDAYEADDEDLDDLIDDDAGETPRQAREWFRRAVTTEGIRAAYTAALDVCRDKKAPAPARATAAMTLLRAAGMLNPKQEDDDVNKDDLANATPVQLDKLIAEARVDGARARAAIERLEREAGLDAQPARRLRRRERKSENAFD